MAVIRGLCSVCLVHRSFVIKNCTNGRSSYEVPPSVWYILAISFITICKQPHVMSSKTAASLWSLCTHGTFTGANMLPSDVCVHCRFESMTAVHFVYRSQFWDSEPELISEDLTQMMFVAGETGEPSTETLLLVEDIVHEQVQEMVSSPSP